MTLATLSTKNTIRYEEKNAFKKNLQVRHRMDKRKSFVFPRQYIEIASFALLPRN